MKICFIAPKAYQLFNPKIKSTFGGAEVQLSLLAKELAKDQKLDINFMVADYGQKSKELINNVKIWKSLNFKKNILSQVFSFFKIFNKINADIYIQRTLTPQSGIIALYCKLKRKKFVYMVAHDRETDETHELYNDFIKSFLAKLTFKLASKIIVQNEYELINLKKRYPKKKISILKKGLKINDFKKNKMRYDAIWVGRCEIWKNPEIFLEMAKAFPKNKFLMICPKATNKEEYFKEILKKASNLKNLNFIEFIENNKITELLYQSKVFIFTSNQEGDWPMTILEATSCCVPVISSKLNYDYLIDKYNGGIYCNNNFNKLKESFKDLILNNKKLKEYSKNAYKYAKDYHNIKVNAKKFKEIISQ
jgi:glycosyltransferase involved in cell wall biosynthesis